MKAVVLYSLSLLVVVYIFSFVAAKQPNIIVIIADDMGYADLGVYGSPSIRTPNLDRMAEEGVKFNSMYTAQPICTPARSALMTGRLPVRNGMYQNTSITCEYQPGLSSVLWWNSIGGIPSTETTLPQLMQKNGYTTALVGKWHIGIGRNYEYLPTRKGFQHFYGIPLWHMGPQGDQSKVPDVPLMRDETIIGRLYATVDVNNLTVMYVDHIQQFLRDNVNNPFFLYYAPDGTHAPTYSSAKFQNSVRGKYGNAVEEMDWSVGQILDQLEVLGIQDNTFVIWSNDNGPALYQIVESGDLEGKLQAGTAGPLKGGKGTTWEGGIRVPAVARWPTRIPAHTVTNELASLMDIFPTVLEMANISVPNGLTLDGKSMTDILYVNGASKHEFLFHWRGDTLYAVSNGPYKAHLWTQGDLMYTTPPIQQHNPPLLFNVKLDPAEQFPLRPADDPNYNKVLTLITQAAKDHMASFTRPAPEFTLCDDAAGMWKPDLPQPPSQIKCCVGGGN